MSYTRVGVPRNTSNGDYGRFHFLPNMANGPPAMQPHQGAQLSSDGNRMYQHVHYPNCSKRNLPPPRKFTDGEKEYTIEYGEDAVRAALGGHMPDLSDFQAQFERQYAGGGGDAGQVATQPMEKGKAKVEPGASVHQEGGNQAGSDSKESESSCENAETPMANPAEISPPVEASVDPVASTSAMGSRQEQIASAYETARRARSNGQVKYGRHVRPSYWKPQTPNPCRKKTMDSPAEGYTNEGYYANGHQQEPEPNTAMQNYNNYPTSNTNLNDMINANGHFPPPAMIPASQLSVSQDYQRTRSLPTKPANRPTYSLCGKCKKCKNLRSEAQEATVLTFPKYSTGGFQRQSQMLTSSNLGQSAKNFRAIRFSSQN